MAAHLAEREPEFFTAEPEGTSPESTPNPPAPRPGEPGGPLVVDLGLVHDRLETGVNRLAEELGEDLPNVQALNLEPPSGPPLSFSIQDISSPSRTQSPVGQKGSSE